MSIAIIWDNDGMLVDTERLYYKATRRIMEGAGFGLTPAEYREYFLQGSQGTWHLMSAAGLSDDAIDALRRQRDDLYQVMLREDEVGIPGVEAVLQDLSDRHPMAVATSNWRTNFDLMHERTGFDRFFDVVVSADDVEAVKPDPALYALAVRRLGREPADCIAFEDSERGLASAKGAGLRCYVIPGPGGLSREADWSGADGVLERIEQVPPLLAELTAD